MSSVTKEAAIQIADLADDGFEATFAVYKNIAIETLQEFGDVDRIRKLGSITGAFNALIKTVRAIQQKNDPAELEEETVALSTIYALYPDIPIVKEGKAVIREEVMIVEKRFVEVREVKRTESPPKLALTSLVSLAKKYHLLSIIARRMQAGLDVYDQLHAAAYDLQIQYDSTNEWSKVYPKEFKPLKNRNHLMEIMPRVESLKERGGTKIIRP